MSQLIISSFHFDFWMEDYNYNSFLRTMEVLQVHKELLERCYTLLNWIVKSSSGHIETGVFLCHYT